MATTNCGETDVETWRDELAAQILKFFTIATILVADVFDVAIPLMGKKRRFLRTDGNLSFVATKIEGRVTKRELWVSGEIRGGFKGIFIKGMFEIKKLPTKVPYEYKTHVKNVTSV